MSPIFHVGLRLTRDSSSKNAVSSRTSNAINYAKFRSRSVTDAVIRVYDDADNVIETHEHEGNFREAS